MSATAKAIAYKLWSLYKAGVLGGASIPATSALLKGDGAGGVSAATAGTDYPGLATANTFTRKQMVDGSQDEVQLHVQGHATQTNPLLLIEKSDGTDRFTLSEDGSFKIYFGGVNDWVGMNSSGTLQGRDNNGIQWMFVSASTVNSIRQVSDGYFGFNSTTDLSGGAIDTGLSRAAAGWVKPDAGGSGAGGFELPQVASGGTPGSNAARVYSKDVAGTAEVHVLDEAGTETQISPHAADGPAWLYDLEDPMPHVLCERNHYLGIARWTNFSRLVRLLSTGQPVTNAPGLATTCVHVASFKPRDWHADQAAKQAAHDTRILERLRKVKGSLAGRAGILPDQVTTAEAYATGHVPAPKDIRKSMPLWMQARFAALNDPREAPDIEAKAAPAAGIFARLKGWLGLG